MTTRSVFFYTAAANDHCPKIATAMSLFFTFKNNQIESKPASIWKIHGVDFFGQVYPTRPSPEKMI